MFLAPCTLPLIPAFILFIAGASGVDMQSAAGAQTSARRRAFVNALAFVAGFSSVFILLGIFASEIGSLLGVYRFALGRGAGAILIVFGLLLLGLRVPFLANEWHMKAPRFVRFGTRGGAFLLGAFFALGWSPCIGPVLGSILFLASASGTALQGAVLLSIFSLGLAVPFLGAALLLDSASPRLEKLAHLSSMLYVALGVILIGIGLSIVVDKFGYISSFF